MSFEFRRLYDGVRAIALLCMLVILAPSCGPVAAQNAAAPLPEVSRNINPHEFVSAVGRRAALLGTVENGFEAWVYPLKIFRDLHLKFHIGGAVLPGEQIARSVTTRPEASTIVYSDAAFQVRETLFVPAHEAGAVITFEIRTERPLEIEVAFAPDFQLEWPADIGPTRLNWDAAKHAFLFNAQNQSYAALAGSPTAQDVPLETPESAAGGETSLLLGMTERGRDTKLLCMAASVSGSNDAAEVYGHLLRDAGALTIEAANYYREYLNRTVSIAVPDVEIQQAYDWARINLLQGMVDNPLVGSGLIAGYGVSGGSERPGYDWFFGRDALWSSLALDAEGDLADTRAALEFLAKYQRGDGKIPHEIPQSATLVPWFETYPYGYAAADATPLFLIAMDDYVQRSGDLTFAKDKWDRISRAYAFLASTSDVNGFSQNAGVGHGWVESGPLVPVRTEIYETALGIEALRAMSRLERLLGKTAEANETERKFQREENLLNELFWAPAKHSFAFALDQNNQRVDETTVLPAVPMWFRLLDPDKAHEMIAHLAAPDMQTDWGMRIVSSLWQGYASEGYHFGSVWPLFTGWASVGEYRYHRDLDAFANLRANALLALDGSPGHVTEVLAGDYYEPLATSTPQQIWSAAMIVAPLLEGLFGLQTNATTNEISLAPHLPAGWGSFRIGNMHAGSAIVTLRFRKSANGMELEVSRTGTGKCVLDFSPALSLRASVRSATLNGRPVPYRVEPNDADQHVAVRFEVPAGKSTLRIRLKDEFELGIEPELPVLGSMSRGLRILARSWTQKRDSLAIDVAGIPGSRYEFTLLNADAISSVEGAELDKSDRNAAKIVVQFPAGGNEYVDHRIRINFVPRHAASRTAASTAYEQKGPLRGAKNDSRAAGAPRSSE
jgi:glycogen debranching enzyme